MNGIVIHAGKLDSRAAGHVGALSSRLKMRRMVLSALSYPGRRAAAQLIQISAAWPIPARRDRP